MYGMELENITLQSLLNDTRIRRKNINGIWYFAQPDLNLIYEDVFKFLQGTPMSVKSPVFYETVYCISYSEIKEQIEYWQNKPSFESRIGQIFKKGK